MSIVGLCVSGLGLGSASDRPMPNCINLRAVCRCVASHLSGDIENHSWGLQDMQMLCYKTFNTLHKRMLSSLTKNKKVSFEFRNSMKILPGMRPVEPTFSSNQHDNIISMAPNRRDALYQNTVHYLIRAMLLFVSFLQHRSLDLGCQNPRNSPRAALAGTHNGGLPSASIGYWRVTHHPTT